MSTKAIRGMRDILPSETPLWQTVETTARQFFAMYGFEEIRTPLVEEIKLFSRTLGESTAIVEKEMYRFTDREGRELVLRPEATASVVRAYIESGRAVEDPLARYYYIGPMYRYERPQRGRYREFYQLGAEALGVSHPFVDAELIDMLGRFLRKVGLKGCELQINSLGCPLCRPHYITAFLAFLTARQENLCDDCQRRMKKNPLRVLDCKTEGCRAIAGEAPSIQEFLCKDCEAHLDQVLIGLGDLGSAYQINPRIVRGLDYYLRTTFEFISTELGAQNAVAGGGRYDGLVAGLGGPKAAGFGFAVGLDRVVELLQADGPRSDLCRRLIFLAPLGTKALREVFKLQAQFRSIGCRVQMDYEGRSLKGQMRQADRWGAAFVVMVGEDELRQGKATVKEMATGTQRNISFRDLTKELGPHALYPQT